MRHAGDVKTFSKNAFVSPRSAIYFSLPFAMQTVKNTVAFSRLILYRSDKLPFACTSTEHSTQYLGLADFVKALSLNFVATELCVS